MDGAGIALVDDFDVLCGLGEVSGEGVEDILSLRRGGHREWASPDELVGLTRRVGKWGGGRGTGGWMSEARGRASRSLGVCNRGGRGAGWEAGAGSQAWDSLIVFCYQLLACSVWIRCGLIDLLTRDVPVAC